MWRVLKGFVNSLNIYNITCEVYIDMTRDCKMCQAGEMGRLWSKDIIIGHKSPQEAAVMFTMTVSEVMEHINSHEIVIDEDAGTYESPDFYINEVLKSLKAVKDWLSYCQLSSSKKKEDFEMFIKLNKELRDTLKCLGEFHGRYGSANNATINIEALNQRYVMITNLLNTEVCPECRLKVIKAVEQMDAMDVPKITSST
mgnify:CR=1 FL=1